MTAPETEHGGIPRPKSWTLELPPGTLLINANQNIHWRDRAKLVKALRQTAWAIARRDKLPALQRAHIFYVFHPDTKGDRRRDSGNWSPSAKAAIDGMVDAGVLPDDNHTRLIGPDPRIGTPVPRSQLVLWITDLDQIHPDHLALLNPPTTLPGATS
jgi:crossover junction endodeoxyribonuclease RusA